MTCADCGGHNVLENMAGSEWGWNYRCFDCDPIRDEEIARGDQFPAYLLQARKRRLNRRGLTEDRKPLTRWQHFKMALGMEA